MITTPTATSDGITVGADGKVKSVTIPAVAPNGWTEYVRATRWNDRFWLHVYDEPDAPDWRPDDDDGEFFSGIPLTAEAALRLGLALTAAAERLIGEQDPMTDTTPDGALAYVSPTANERSN